MSSRNYFNSVKTATKIQLSVAVLMLLLVIVLITGTTLARYESQNTSEITMDIQQSKRLYLLSGNISESGEYEALSDWKSSSDGEYGLDFLLANGNSKDNICSYSQNVSLQVVATLGVEKTENIQLILSVDSEEYTAVATEIKKDTNLYNMYGPGWVYKFCNKAGEELSWKLIGGKLNYKEMSLKVKSNSSYPINLSLITNSTQAIK